MPNKPQRRYLVEAVLFNGQKTQSLYNASSPCNALSNHLAYLKSLGIEEIRRVSIRREDDVKAHKITPEQAKPVRYDGLKRLD